MQRLTLTQPDDWHVHLRDGDYLRTTDPHIAREFGRAIIMPNLKPPVTTLVQAEAYRAHILAARPPGSAFVPLMTLYLTEGAPRGGGRRARRGGGGRGGGRGPAGAAT